MADESHEIELVISAKERAREAISRVRNEVRDLASTVARYGRVIALALGTAVGAIGLLANQGAKVDSVANVFEATAERVGTGANDLLAHLRRVTRDTVSEFQLMAQANAALGTGAISLQDFGTTLEFVGLKAKATGEDVGALTDKIVTGLLRGSVMLLDDALPTLTRELDKLNVDGLSEADKKTVTLAVAFKLMREELVTLRRTSGDTRDVIDSTKIAFVDLKDGLTQVVSQSPAVRQALELIRDGLERADTWVQRNRGRIDGWVQSAIRFAAVAKDAALGVVAWVRGHTELLGTLAKVGAIVALFLVLGKLRGALGESVGTLGMFTAAWLLLSGSGSPAVHAAAAMAAATVAVANLGKAVQGMVLAGILSKLAAQFITNARAAALLSTALRIGLVGGTLGAVVAGLASLAFGATAVANAFRRARLEKRGFTSEGVDLERVAQSLQGMPAQVVSRPVFDAASAKTGLPTRAVRDVQNAAALVETVRELIRSNVLSGTKESILERLIGDAELTKDLDEKAKKLETLRSMAIQFVEFAQARRLQDEHELEHLREETERFRGAVPGLDTGGGVGTDIQALIESLRGAGDPVDELSKRFELLRAHVQLGDETAASYRERLLEVRSEALRLAEAHKGNAEAVAAAAEVYAAAGVELERFREAEERATEASLDITGPLLQTIELFQALRAVGQLTTEEVGTGLENVRQKILELSRSETLTVEQTIALAAALEKVDAALEKTDDTAQKVAEGIAQAVGQAITNSIRALADTLGLITAKALFKDLEGADQPWKRFLASILDVMGEMLIGAGVLALGIGSVVEGIKSAIMTLSGAPAVAVGIAAIAMGALLKGASVALMSSVQKAGQGSAPAASNPFRVNLPGGAQEPDTIVNVFVLDELGERRVQRLQKKLSSNQRRDVSIRVPLGG